MSSTRDRKGRRSQSVFPLSTAVGVSAMQMGFHLLHKSIKVLILRERDIERKRVAGG